MKYVSVFSGIEAASVAFGPLGWTPVCFSEIDTFASAVLKYRYPGVPNAGDITKIDWKEVVSKYGRPDVLVGGSPCQSFSIAGGRESLDGESRLLFEYLRAVEELLPRWVLWENVPGVLNTKDDAFGQLLDSLQDLGYVDLAWRVLDAQFFGVAQRRRRVFLVGHLGAGGASAAVLFEPESMRGNTQTSREKREELARAAGRSSKNGFGSLARDTHVPLRWSCALRMRSGKEGGGKGPLIQDDLSGTLATANDQTVFVMASGHSHAEIGKNLSPTIAAHAMKDPPILIDRAAFNQGRNAMYEPHIEATEVCDTLVARGPCAVAFEDSCQFYAVTIHDGSRWVVRRLTPMECERLQGFPDGWTDVPYRGAEHPSDAPRYKALGNSMAVPVMRWIGERMEIVDGILQDPSKRKVTE